MYRTGYWISTDPSPVWPLLHRARFLASSLAVRPVSIWRTCKFISKIYFKLELAFWFYQTNYRMCAKDVFMTFSRYSLGYSPDAKHTASFELILLSGQFLNAIHRVQCATAQAVSPICDINILDDIRCFTDFKPVQAYPKCVRTLFSQKHRSWNFHVERPTKRIASVSRSPVDAEKNCCNRLRLPFITNLSAHPDRSE